MGENVIENVMENGQPVKMPALIIGGIESGVGKTTFTCGLLKLLLERGLRPGAFKCGLDYIDPSFHEQVLNTSVRNLDLFLAEPDIVRALYASHAAGYDISIIEGAVSYYGGIGYETKTGTWELAETLQIPVILLVSADSSDASLEAMIKGLLEKKENSHIAGVVFNNMSAAGYPEAAKAAEKCGVEALGYLPHEDVFHLRSRQQGIVIASEAPRIKETIDHIAGRMAQTVDLDRILEIARLAAPQDVEESKKLLEAQITDGIEDEENGPVIGVAKDISFCLYYEDNLEFLKACGARIAYFSPMYDSELPAGCSALYLGDGYPELSGETLAHNQKIVQAVRLSIMNGMPCVAECAGYLYLHERLEGAERSMYPMTAVISGDAVYDRKHKHFGHVEMTTDKDCLLTSKGETIRAYSFHYWQSKGEKQDIMVRKVSDGESWQEGICSDTLYAAFPHLYFRGCPEAGMRFVQAARDYRDKKEKQKQEQKRNESNRKQFFDRIFDIF